jgi:type I restriction-modification system DNA methylase subunit
MADTKERLIDGLRDELYKKHSWTGETAVHFMVPIILAIRHKDDEGLRKGKEESESIVWALRTLMDGGKRELDTVLNQFRQKRTAISPLLRETLDDMISKIGRQPDGIILEIFEYLNVNRAVLYALRDEDFIGTLFERSVSDAFRGDDGRFYTPRNIILLMREMLRLLLSRENAKRPLSSYTVCDPCCGSARFLIYWSELIMNEIKSHDPKIKRSRLLKEMKQKAEAQLFGADIHEETAAFGCLNMLLHGDGATNITGHDSLDHFGFFSDVPLLREFANEFQENWDKYRDGAASQRDDLAKLLQEVSAKRSIVIELLAAVSIDLSDPKWLDLSHVVRKMIEADGQYGTNWKSIRRLRSRFKRQAVFETMVDEWGTRNADVRKNFEVVISNPPFGRKAELLISDKYLLCQYQLATEVWVKEMTKATTESVLRQIIGTTGLVQFYISLVRKHFGKELVGLEDEVPFHKLSPPRLRRLVEESQVLWAGNSKQDLVNILVERTGRHIVASEDSVRLEELTNSEAKRVCSNYLYDLVGPGEILAQRIIKHFGKEWLTVEDVFGPSGFSSKVDLIFNGGRHTIYYDYGGEPIVFKSMLPKQVLFIEQFLRMVKDGGKVFTVLDTGVLSNIGDEYVRRFIYRHARVLSVVELPHGAFKAADADVKTAIVLLEKGHFAPKYKFFGSLPMNLGYRLNDQNVPAIPENDLGRVLCDYSVYLGLDPLLESCCRKPSKKAKEHPESCNWFDTGRCKFWENNIGK